MIVCLLPKLLPEGKRLKKESSSLESIGEYLDETCPLENVKLSIVVMGLQRERCGIDYAKLPKYRTSFGRETGQWKRIVYSHMMLLGSKQDFCFGRGLQMAEVQAQLDQKKIEFQERQLSKSVVLIQSFERHANYVPYLQKI
jgi:hypothetical protein